MERSSSSMAGAERSRVTLGVAVLLGVACWLGGAGDALAAGTFVVDGADPTKCSDTAPAAGTEGNPPYCTISAAAAARGGPGTTILVKPAIYREQVTVRASGAEGSPFTFQALGAGVVVDGADDFASPAQWALFSGDVWLAKSVTWSPLQVFVDGARLSASTAPQAELPPGTFRYVLGEGLYVNLGGDNPGAHQTLVGRRINGFLLSRHAWVTIDSFTVSRTEDRGIHMRGPSDDLTFTHNITITHNTVTFAGRHGIAVEGTAKLLIGANVVSDSSHGINVSWSASVTVQDNEAFRNLEGIRLENSAEKLLQRNNIHDNAGTGIKLSGSYTPSLFLQNRSWQNGGRGYELLPSENSIHVGDVAWGNHGDGFYFPNRIFNSIGVNNGLATGGFNLVCGGPGLLSNYNLWWNATSQAPISCGTEHATIAAFTAATGQDANSLQADPRFVHAAGGDLRLLPGSPAIDSADSSVSQWPATDAAGQARVDDPATANSGAGPVPYADRGALEFLLSGPPLAALTVTPATGRAPLAVTADASRSADPDGTIASYLFDFGDGTVVGPQAGATASHSYPQVGTFAVTVTVTDDGGETAAASAPVTVAPPTHPPVAALTVRPAAGGFPLAVIADASGSSDPDGTIVAYRFDFGDGVVVGPQPEATASRTYGAVGIFTVTVTVTDDLGATGSASATVTVARDDSLNWVGNGSFEFNTSGWSAYGGATLQRVPGGVEGAFALEVRGPATTMEFGINDSPNWVAKTPAAGTRYRFSAWVRSGTSSARARLKVREYLNRVQVGGATASAALDLTPGWQLLSLDHVTQAASSTLDFHVLALPLAPGAVFETDQIAIRIVTSTTNQPPNGTIDTPATNVTIPAGQSVTFTGTGSDPDGHLPLTFLWTFGDGAANSTAEDPGAVVFSTPGTYTVTFTVIDSLGLADPTPDRRVIVVADVSGGSNLVRNPSFESDTSGWGAYGGATIQRVPGGQEGAFALEVRGSATTAAFGINDSPNWINSTGAAGTRYRFSAWVRSEASTGRARIRIREYLNGVLVGTATHSAPVVLASSWQLLTVDHVAQAAGSTLDVQVLDYPVAPGEVFQVDNIGIGVVP